MDQFDRLVDAIRREPDRDDLRSALADELDRIGDPRFAEFVRLQCARATAAPGDGSHVAWTARERELWDQNGDAFIRRAVADPRAADDIHRNRFVSQIEFDRGLPHRLTTDARYFVDNEFGRLVLLACPTIRALTFKFERDALGDDEIARLVTPEFHRLTEMRFSFRQDQYSGGRRPFRPLSLAQAVSRAPLQGLKTLEIHAHAFEDEEFRELVKPNESTLVGLTQLLAGRNHLTAAGLRTLAASPILVGLKSLDLSGNPVGDSLAAVLPGATFAAGLKDLSVVGCDLSPRGLRDLARAVPGLERIVADESAATWRTRVYLGSVLRTPGGRG
jgi:uncharacterized protein (TIGR02996 family)